MLNDQEKVLLAAGLASEFLTELLKKRHADALSSVLEALDWDGDEIIWARNALRAFSKKRKKIPELPPEEGHEM